jgi:eukaryotic-like serine/threonine-protein kinase
MQPIQENAEPLPGYRLVSRLGRGGCGEVWKAEAPGGIPKAIKFVPGDGDGASPGLAEREHRSLHRVKEVRHPFVLSVERFDVVDGRLVIVMELADRNLWDRFAECQADGLSGIPRDELLGYLAEVAEALDLMSTEHQLQHLDVKPENIFLVHQHVKVGDFGLAQEVHGPRAALKGGMTPAYAAPETIDRWASRQSDQYSLAIVFVEMLTGRRPFDGTTARQLVVQHLTGTPDLSALSPADGPVVARALAKTPADRFRTCTEFVQALRTATAVPAAAVGRTPVVAVPAQGPLPGSGPMATPKTQIQTPSRTPRRTPVPPSSAVSRTGGAERVADEVLFPALVVGVGGTGLAALRHLRRLVHERFGTPILPNLRWLLVDTDAAALATALDGPSNEAFTADEVLLVPPRPPAAYRDRPELGSFDTRLTEDTATRLPPVPATHGIRGLGRLALADHYAIVRSRVRAALNGLSALDPLAEAGRLTGLGARSGAARVYLVASVAGGTGSGMLIDLAYLIRRQLRDLRLSTDHLVGLLALPTVDEPAAAANARRALAELRHHSRPGTTYEAGFEPDAAPIVDTGRPFRRCTLLPGATAPATAAHLVFLDALTPVGRALYPDRAAAPENPCTAVGLRRVVWPRERLVVAAADRLARHTLSAWAAAPTAGTEAMVAAEVERAWTDGRLDPAHLGPAVGSGVTRQLGRPIDAVVRDILPETSAGPEVAGPALDRLTVVFGIPDAEEPDGNGQVVTALGARAADLAREANERLVTLVESMLERPGYRVAAAREAVRLLRARLTIAKAAFQREATGLADDVRNGFHDLRERVGSGDLADFPARAGRWADARFRCLRDKAAAGVYRRLNRTLTQLEHEVAQVGAGLSGLNRDLAAADVTPPADGVCEYLLPAGDVSLAAAADRLASGFLESARRDFDELVQSKLRATGRGLAQVAVRPRESIARLARLLRTEAERFVRDRSPRMSAADGLAKQFPDRAELEAFVRTLIESATPAGVPTIGAVEVTLLGVPADPGGPPLAEVVRALAGDGLVSEARTPDEVVVLREYRGVSLDSLVERLAQVRSTEVTVLPSADLTSPSTYE